jgi:rubrerythrin
MSMSDYLFLTDVLDKAIEGVRDQLRGKKPSEMQGTIKPMVLIQVREAGNYIIGGAAKRLHDVLRSHESHLVETLIERLETGKPVKPRWATVENSRKVFERALKTATRTRQAMLSTIPIDLDSIDQADIDKEILRLGMIAELDAVSLYEQMAAKAQDARVKEVLLDIAKEEKTHVGEFQTLLRKLDPEYTEELKAGEKEVREMRENPRKAFEQAMKKYAATPLVAIKGNVDFLYNPFTGFVQVGMGGEWWTGEIKGTGRYIFKHRKELVDPGYAPVHIAVSREGKVILFDITGGFGDEAAFELELN